MVHGIPRSCDGGKKVSAAHKSRKLIKALIVRRLRVHFMDVFHTLILIFTVERNLSSAHRLPRFVEHRAFEQGIRSQAQHEMLGVHARAGYNRGRESLVLFVGRGNESSFGRAQRVLAGAELAKLKISVRRSQSRLWVL